MHVGTLHRCILQDVKEFCDVINDYFDAEYPDSGVESLNLTQFLAGLNTITHKYGIHNKYKKHKEIAPKHFAFEGFCRLPNGGRTKERDITITWCRNPDDSSTMHLSRRGWRRQRFFFWSTLFHELIHRHQNQLRVQGSARVFRPTSPKDSTLNAQQMYYGDFDEVETNAFEAALEIFIRYPRLSLKAAISRIKAERPRTFDFTYCAYQIVFFNNEEHPAVQAFKRKVWEWHVNMKKDPVFYQRLRLPKLQ